MEMVSKSFIILGMHRSATSLIAKGLVQAGVSMGDKMLGGDTGNPHGYFEDVEFLNLNKYILATAHGNWMNVPLEEDILKLSENQQITAMIKRLISQRQTKPLWGWKDPRTTLTIKLFMPYLQNPHFIACFRDPVEVAKSLERRNGFPIPMGMSLAKAYNDRLSRFIDEWYSGKIKNA